MMDLTYWVLLVNVLSGVVFFSESFNVDIKTARVKQGKRNTSFGFKAEFIQRSGSTSLLVTAPNEPVTSRYQSGIHYYCNPTTSHTACTAVTSPFETDYPLIPRDPDYGFGEKAELFGLGMTMADKNTAVVCGPQWQNYHWYHTKHSFTIGRCCIQPSSKRVLPYSNKDKYVAAITYDGNTDRQMLYGMAQFGFSAAGNEDGRVVIGAPGFSMSRGGVVVLDTKDANYNYTRMETLLDPEPDSLLGYTVAVGNFCGPERTCFVVSNRQALGKVYVMEFAQGSENKFPAPLWKKEAEQSYSSFGLALCAMDVNGDGWADLLVGAPTYSAFVNDTRIYDTGRVYVYISYGEVINGQDNFYLASTLIGDEVQFSRFGYAIGNIGDLNRDSFYDVAVGAPMDEEGAGAVYIYLGSPNGPLHQYSQKIRGQDFTPPLSSFGFHISKPTSDLSSYGYPDFAVGAPESDAVVFLQTRLLVNAQLTIHATPNPLDPINDVCPSWVDIGATRPSGCLNVSICLNFTYSTTGLTGRSFDSLDFDVDLELDQLIANDGLRRVRLYDTVDKSTVTAYSTKLTVSKDSPNCTYYMAVLKKDQIDRNRFSPVQLHASFKLNTTSFTGIPPIRNQSMPNSDTKQIQFKNKCGDDAKCHADLVLRGRVQHKPDDSTYDFNVVNRTSQVELVLDLLNKKETAFGLRITTNITGSIAYRTATGKNRISCSPMVGSVLTCESLAPVIGNETSQIRLQFLANSVPLKAENRQLQFKVKVMPHAENPNDNPEVNPGDNVKTFTSRTAIVADLGLDGWPDPRRVRVQDSDQGNVRVTHKLLLTNRGPSFLPSTHLNVTLPFQDSTGADMLDHANVTIRFGQDIVFECPPVVSTDAQVATTTTPPTTTTTGASVLTTTASSGRTTSSPGTTDDPFGEVAISKRRRRQADNVQNDVSAKDDGQQLKMDCGRYRCRVYKCELPPLQPNKKAEINVTVIILRSAIVFPGNIDTLYYTTTTEVGQPDHPLFYEWNEPRFQEVMTEIRRLSSAEKINIWIIIGGVIGGLLLLIIIAVVAWKLGFFKREDKAKLERLKRQSGFYESNRSVKRKSQRATSSGSAAAAEKQ